MDELKKFIYPDKARTVIWGTVLCVLIAAVSGVVINHVHDRSAVIIALVFTGLALAPFITVFIIWLICYVRIGQQLKQISKTPGLQKEIIDDFCEAARFWDGEIRIGVKNVYEQGFGMFERRKGMVFSYRQEHSRTYHSWIVLLMTEHGNKRRILSRDMSRCSEYEIRYEVEKANRYINNAI